MIELQVHNGFYRCEAYGFAEWLVEIQGLIQKGYEFDFESNSNYPMQIGHIYTAILKPKVVTEVVTNFPPIVEPVEETKDVLVIAPWKEAVVAQEATVVAKQETEKTIPEVYPGGSPDTPEMTSKSTNLVLPDKQAETLPVLPVDEAVSKEETVVAKQETDQPSKRGPKPKN